MLTLTLLLLAVLIAIAWRDALRAREAANGVAIETCQRANVQFLDGTVAFSGMRPTRAAGGRFALRRSYVFDYTSDGVTRSQGFVVIRGDEIEAVGLAPDRSYVH